MNTQTMNEKEIKEGLQLFQKLLKEKNINCTHADPMRQNCYISSNDIIGVYFPNTEFEFAEHRHFYDFNSISKVGGKLGLIFSLKDDKHDENGNPQGWLCEYIFNSFESYFYDSKELEIKEQITKDLNLKIKELNTLKAIKPQRTKTGEYFKNLKLNYNLNFSVEYATVTFYPNYNMNECEPVYLWVRGNTSKLTAQELDKIIIDTISAKENAIKELKSQLKTLNKDFAKIKKIKNNLLKEFNGLTLRRYFADYIKKDF